MGGASNTSDDSGGGSSYSDQLKKSQRNWQFFKSKFRENVEIIKYSDTQKACNRCNDK